MPPPTVGLGSAATGRWVEFVNLDKWESRVLWVMTDEDFLTARRRLAEEWRIDSMLLHNLEGMISGAIGTGQSSAGSPLNDYLSQVHNWENAVWDDTAPVVYIPGIDPNAQIDLLNHLIDQSEHDRHRGPIDKGGRLNRDPEDPCAKGNTYFDRARSPERGDNLGYDSKYDKDPQLQAAWEGIKYKRGVLENLRQGGWYGGWRDMLFTVMNAALPDPTEGASAENWAKLVLAILLGMDTPVGLMGEGVFILLKVFVDKGKISDSPIDWKAFTDLWDLSLECDEMQLQLDYMDYLKKNEGDGKYPCGADQKRYDQLKSDIDDCRKVFTQRLPRINPFTKRFYNNGHPNF